MVLRYTRGSVPAPGISTKVGMKLVRTRALPLCQPCAARVWTDDFYWHGPDYDPLPQAGGFDGPDAVFEMFGELQEHWDDMSVMPDEFIEDGNTVVALGHVRRRPSRV